MVRFYLTAVRPHQCLFFFQAEDGIRYRNVTGVQTCALPICFYALHRQRWIDLSNRLANRACKRFRRLRCAHVERGVAERLGLGERREYEGSLFFTNVRVFLIYCHAYNLDVGLHSTTRSSAESRADWILSIQILP